MVSVGHVGHWQRVHSPTRTYLAKSNPEPSVLVKAPNVPYRNEWERGGAELWPTTFSRVASALPGNSGTCSFVMRIWRSLRGYPHLQFREFVDRNCNHYTRLILKVRHAFACDFWMLALTFMSVASPPHS